MPEILLTEATKAFVFNEIRGRSTLIPVVRSSLNLPQSNSVRFSLSWIQETQGKSAALGRSKSLYLLELWEELWCLNSEKSRAANSETRFRQPLYRFALG
jgi:hypothetical protein